MHLATVVGSVVHCKTKSWSCYCILNLGLDLGLAARVSEILQVMQLPIATF